MLTLYGVANDGINQAITFTDFVTFAHKAIQGDIAAVKAGSLTNDIVDAAELQTDPGGAVSGMPASRPRLYRAPAAVAALVPPRPLLFRQRHRRGQIDNAALIPRKNTMKYNNICQRWGWLNNLIGGVVLFAASMWAPLYGAGVTIITHGFELFPQSHTSHWLEAMGDYISDIANINGGATTVYKIVVTGGPIGGYKVSVQYDRGQAIATNQNAEVIIKLYWDTLAEEFDVVATQDIAKAVAPIILAGNLAVVGAPITHSLSEMPIHVIGHSRGASVMCELARLLGENGVWVDQLTTLDPHPVQFPLGHDADVRIFENVLNADNYYEHEVLTVPAGQEITQGAYNRRLNGQLKGGYGDLEPDADHSDVHLWYHGTVNTVQHASDGDVRFTDDMRANWYVGPNDLNGNPDEQHGANAGYHFSRLNGHLWDGSYDGYFNFQNFDNNGDQTPGNRVALNRSQSNQWPNIIKIGRGDTESVQAGGQVNLEYTYQSYNQDASVSIYISTDQNPYSSNGVKLSTTDLAWRPKTNLSTPTVHVSGAIPSTVSSNASYYLYAKITAANGLTRYTYASKPIYISQSVEPGPQPPIHLTAKAISSSLIALAWKPGSSNATGYRVEQQIGATGDWKVVADKLPIKATTFSDTGLSNKTKYSYRVAAFNAALPAGVYSDIVQATTLDSTVVTHTLTVQSANPNSGIFTLIDPVDMTGAGDGYTQFVRTFSSSSSVFLSVPETTTGGKVFQEWRRNGVHFSNNAAISVTTDADYEFLAVYTDPVIGGGSSGAGIVAQPTISPNGGNFSNAVTVSLSCATSDALLRYTIDGTQPTIYSPAYTGSFSVTQGTTVIATAFKPNTNFSATSMANFTISYSQGLPMPVFTPNGGTSANPLNVGIVCSEPNSEIYYTVDGSIPQRSTNRTTNVVAVYLNQTTSIKARAFKDGVNPSPVATATFTVTNPLNNNNFSNRIRLFGPENATEGSNVGATSESGEPRIYRNDKPQDPTEYPANHSVWWVWRAPYTGTVTFDTSGAPGSWNGPSNFDNRLGVFTGSSVSSLTTIGGDDDSGYGNYCGKFTFNAIAETDYNIAVDGGPTGRIELYWKMSTPPPPLPPYTPTNIFPADGQAGIMHRAVIRSSQFRDFNAGDSHAASEWIVTRTSDSSVVFDSGEDAVNKESLQLTVPLDSNTSYTFIVRHKDSHGDWSDYSSPTSFLTRGPDPVTVNITSPTQNSNIVGASASVTGSATANFGITEVRWTTDFGMTGTVPPGAAWTIAQIPIHPNQNTVVIAVKDDDGNIGTASVQLNGTVPDTIKPVLAILFPTPASEFTANTRIFYLSGRASDDNGVSSVTWKNDRGGEGTAFGSAVWVTGPITLVNGDNVITVRASDSSGNFAEKSLTLHASLPPAETQGPSINIGAPINGATVNGANVTVSGSASDAGLGDDGISSVTVNGVDATGGIADASNTANWTAPITLSAGQNTITVVAKDNFGNVSTKLITVTYSPAPTTLLLSATKTGGGRITSPLTGIDTNGIASHSYAIGTTVNLTVTADPGWCIGGMNVLPDRNASGAHITEPSLILYLMGRTDPPQIVTTYTLPIKIIDHDKTLVVSFMPQPGSGLVAPTIISGISRQLARTGDSVTFSVAATGNPTPVFLWTFNGAEIPGETGSTLILNDVDLLNSGTYSAIVSNLVGSVHSDARLTVSPLRFGVLQFSTAFAQGMKSAGSINVSVERVDGLDHSVGVDYVTFDGKAVAGVDYISAAGTLIFPEGVSMVSINIPLINSASTEGNKTFGVELVSVSGGASLGLLQTSVVTIKNERIASFPGTYCGLIQAPTPTEAASGSLSLTLSQTRNFTASIVFGGIRYTLRNAFSQDGTYSGEISGHGLPPLPITLLQDGAGGISGTIADGAASIVAAVSPYSMKNPAPSGMVGRYTALLPRDPLHSEASAPQGTGYGTVTVGKTGAIRFSGSLGDGTKISQSSSLSMHGDWPFFAAPYRAGGSVAGWLTFRDVTGTSDVDGSLVWIKVGSSHDARYPLGFTLQVPMMASHYTITRGKRLLDRFVDKSSNATFSIADGNLSSTPPPKWLTFQPINVVSIASKERFSFRITTATGLFTGSFNDPGTGKAKAFGGVLFQKQFLGEGLFIGNQQTGSVMFGPSENSGM